MRTSELIGLMWSDVDMTGKSIRIHSARTEGVDTGSTKIARQRTLEPATPLALRGLRAQRSKSKGIGHVFRQKQDPDEPVHDDQQPRRAWTRALETADIRHRRAYETRHTFATLHLMHGADILEVSRDLGHKSVSMTWDDYAKWIPDERKRSETQIEAFS